jgi:hypothetical protein
MELILTLSNLEGFTYELGFSAEGASKHIMKQHRDYAFFRLGSDYGGDGRIPLNLQRRDRGLEELLQAAPATGAFPVGLAYRKFVRKKKYILDNQNLVYYAKDIVTLQGISDGNVEEDFVTYNVDGGMLNNEPFDLTMKIMAKASDINEVAINEELRSDERDFDTTIIMIDPFPSDDSITSDKADEKKGGRSIRPFDLKFPFSLIGAIGKVFQSMRGELLFKGEDIVKAFSKKDFSRFMISPRRRIRNKDGKKKEEIFNGSVAIACGALGGFSGFFDKKFREHDFYLGRANCQSFIRKYFRVKLEQGVPVNRLFANGYSAEAVSRFKFQDPLEMAELQKLGKNPNEANWYVPIIPDLYIGDPNNWDPRYTEEPIEYPSYDMNVFVGYKSQILRRFKVVAKSLQTKWWHKMVTKLVFLFFSNLIYKKLQVVIEQQFINWRLIKK